ncbi:MAG: PAS domain-containing protein, partial [Candidatus Zixiibacteriota bacterium]
PIGVIILDLDDRITMLNPAARGILGVEAEEIIGCPLAQLSTIPGFELAGMTDGETRLIKVSGVQTYKCRKSHFLDRGFHRHFLLIEELTREILETQKRAYGRVIRMMSHEVNNSVGAVNSIMQSSLTYAERLPPEEKKEFGDAVNVAMERNSGLNKFMANFADVVRIPLPIKEAYDLHSLLKSVHILMSAECDRRGISWEWQLSPAPMIVEIDPHQIEQVLVNVVKNAIEAIEKDGSITIRTMAASPCTLSIVDDGKGIGEEQRQRLFTPFYSTKKDGQGIGLTLIREILVNHGFSFNLESVSDGGTEFWINFDGEKAGQTGTA